MIKNGLRIKRIDARVTISEKKSLLMLAKKKGCAGITGLLKLLASAKKVDIKT